ncbi:L-seryl-tRNA(Sec) kinase isoform X1 [Dendrobates tinctorius]|uniref:L-seryl-tRNA(Sec) kinase isoform X1 n=1 Tax=Dendrobates tinctorius TaxID=92724 RepID=UPI003CCA0898
MDEPDKNSHIGLCLLCGLPGAGKSTLARQLQNGHSGFPVVVISYDDVIADRAFKDDAVHEYRDVSCQSENEGARETSPWKLHRRRLLQCLEHFIISLLNHSPLHPPSGTTDGTWKGFVQGLESQGVISAGEDSDLVCLSQTVKSGPVCVILDDNFYYQSMRHAMFQLARTYSLGFCQIFLHCPVDCCLLRNNRRKDRVADSTIILMDSKIEKPNPEKNSWETRSLFLDSSDGIDMDEVSARITNLMKQALENPVLPIEGESTEKERDRDICATNLIHREDQNLRRLISETMQTVKGLVSAKDIKTIAQELQQAKSKALDQLRHSITGQTALTPSTESISGVQSSFREEVDCIVQRYSRRVQVASPVAPSDST